MIPLRGPHDPGRVNVYRKQVRDGVLPPVLLWWISGLCAYVILDGHARLTAALAEGGRPAFLALERAADRPSGSEDFLREYARRVAITEDAAARGVPGAPRALTDLRPGHERTEGEPRD